MAAKIHLIDWTDIQLLLAFGASSGLTAAALAIGIDATTLGRRLRNLEDKLGLSLIIHEGRNLRLTDAGHRVLNSAKEMEEIAERMMRQITDDEPRAEGVVRLTALRSILRCLVMPSLPEFRKAYPAIVLNLLGDARNFAVGRREADLAIRLAMPHGPDLAARKLFDVPFVQVGAKHLGWITYDENLSTVPEAQWVAKNVAPEKIILQANSMELILEAVRAGVGQAILPTYLATGLPTGSIILVREAWLVVHNETRRSPRIRAVADWIISESSRFQGAFGN